MTMFGLFFAILGLTLARVQSLHVLFYMPCIGGHFGTMSSLLVPICEQHNCTVVETAKLCEQKLKSFHERVQFDTLKPHHLPDEFSFKGAFHFLFKFCSDVLDVNKPSYDNLENILEEKSGEFDVIITDLLFLGTMIIAEKHDIPIIVQSPGAPGGVEHLADKWHVSMHAPIMFKVAYRKCFAWIEDKRAENGLVPLDYQDQFSSTEYFSRFPLLVPTSPMFYPKPHSSVEHIFIGGHRNETHYQPLSEEMESWISREDAAAIVVYISLGTHYVMDGPDLKKFVESVRQQNEYRVIWSTSLGFEKVVNDLGLRSDERVMFSGFLPQYTLLGHPKVRVFVSHGGLGSIIDLVKRHKPSILVPQFGDQFSNAIQLESLSAAIRLNTFTFETVNDAIGTILENYNYYENAVWEIANNFSKYESKESLLDFVDKIAARKKVTIQHNLQFRINHPKYPIVWKIGCFLFLMTTLAFGYLVWKTLANIIFNKNQPKKKKTN